jgi:5-hydroxyisourate hydrolase-like protein (transthyretin family)
MKRLALAILLSPAPQLAQSAPSATLSGTITGHVLDAATQRPARFAEVYLIPRVNTSSLDENTAIGKLYMVNVNTGLDGSYKATLPPGEYYVVPHLDGYISQLEADPNVKTDKDILSYARVFAHYPLIKITADRTVNVDVSMSRGAVVSGRVLFDDGSPAVHQAVQIIAVGTHDVSFALDPVVSSIEEDRRLVQTDDNGRYRFAGLPPGKYNLSVTLEAEKSKRAIANESGAFYSDGPPGAYLTIYAPSAFRQSDSKPLEIKAEESRLEENIEIDITKLHNIQGHISSAVDHHPLSGGIVRLVEAATPAQFMMVTTIRSDGSYSLPNVPSGEYSLTVERGADIQHGLQPDDITVLKRYAKGKLTILVLDRDVIAETLELPEQK